MTTVAAAAARLHLCVWCNEPFAPGTHRARRIHPACRAARVAAWRRLWKLVKPRKGPMGSSDAPVGTDQPQSHFCANDKKNKNIISVAPGVHLDPHDTAAPGRQQESR